ncbi:MAG: adenylate/guanylate cyclase domain-containing protein [Akkermansiaceae bacterium]
MGATFPPTPCFNPSVTIRWKLFLSLFLLTTGTIAVVLVVAERRFHQWVEAEITAQFESQVNGLREARSERLADVRKICEDLAANPAVRAELSGKNTHSLRKEFMEEVVRRCASNQNRERDEPETDSRRIRGNPRGPDTDRNSKKRLISGATGKGIPTVGVIDLQGNPKTLGGPLQRARRRQQQSGSLNEIPNFTEQGVAYVVTEPEGNKRPMVKEVVVTRVADNQGKPLGWFFLGYNPETQVERAFQQTERSSGREARSGLVAEGEWFIEGISQKEAKAIKSKLSDTFWTSGQPEMIEVDGINLMGIAHDLNPGSPLGKGYQVTFFPMDRFAAAIGSLHNTVLWIGAGGILITSLLALVLARRFSQPISELVAGTERIRQGNLQSKVKVRSNDEFGTLATAFNAMTSDLALKERYREVLSKVSDPDVAQQLVEGQLELGGEVRHAAVLFCDIRGFTAMTEGMPPAEVIDFVNEHMTALTKLVYLHGGVVDKFVGDLIMAIFGAPNSHGDDAQRAARCALEMIQVRHDLSQKTGRLVEVGIGLSYGELVAGCMGSTDRLNYTVLGDRVNLAARLCSAAGPGEVICDEAIAATLDNNVHAQPRERVALKGFTEPVSTFALTKRSE